MTVNEFIKAECCGAMFKVVDATKPGYMVSKSYIVWADRNVVTKECGDLTVKGFEATGKNKITIYVV